MVSKPQGTTQNPVQTCEKDRGNVRTRGQASGIYIARPRAPSSRKDVPSTVIPVTGTQRNNSTAAQWGATNHILNHCSHTGRKKILCKRRQSHHLALTEKWQKVESHCGICQETLIETLIGGISPKFSRAKMLQQPVREQ